MAISRKRTFQLRGLPAIAVIALIAIGPFFVGTRGDVSKDEALKAALERAITSEHTLAMLPKLTSAVEQNDEEEATELAAGMNNLKPRILSIRAASPLFAFRSRSRTVVFVRYTRNGSDDRIEEGYFRLSGSKISGWGYAQRTSSVSYYMNFL